MPLKMPRTNSRQPRPIARRPGLPSVAPSAHGVNDDNVMVVTAANLQEISPLTVEEGQGTIPGAVTAVTAVTDMESGTHTIDTQDSIPHMTDHQQAQSTKPETIQNAGEIYWSGTNWYCKHCKLFGDKFDMEVHMCKGYTPTQHDHFQPV